MSGSWRIIGKILPWGPGGLDGRSGWTVSNAQSAVIPWWQHKPELCILNLASSMQGRKSHSSPIFNKLAGTRLRPPALKSRTALSELLQHCRCWKSHVRLCISSTSMDWSSLASRLQGITHFKDIQYNDLLRYGDIYMQQEFEMSCYYLDQADIAIQQSLYDLLEKVTSPTAMLMHRSGWPMAHALSAASTAQEANSLLIKKLPVPAYQQLLKLSHCFNILDARGAIGVTQRAQCFATMRQLARKVSGKAIESSAGLFASIKGSAMSHSMHP